MTQLCTTAVILAAGRGKRMLHLTEEKPKPMVLLGGKNLIEWKIDALPSTISNVVIVVGYQGEQIKEFFGDSWKGRVIRYATQTELNGTAGALWAAKDLLEGKFLVLMGDDIYDAIDIRTMMNYDLAVCVADVHERETGGEIFASPDGTLLRVHELRHYVKDGLVNTGMCILDKRFFDYKPVLIGEGATEVGIPNTIAVLAKDFPVHVVKATKWMQISSPEDIQRAEREFLL